ncbi:jg15724 [Pararge aegeria aegeria]|uniref:Jg15724 protein n=1 Tax=Pararge aegeria aegeria TaxID=348720 RepID=A0A8S4SIB9_9NEOP|nr:jg15724 [Pararge aegeria aegeria]
MTSGGQLGAAGGKRPMTVYCETPYKRPMSSSGRRLVDMMMRLKNYASTVVAAMLAEDEAWIAMVTFCEIVMAKKEAAERDRERADPSRRRPRRADGNHRPIPSDL